MTEPLSKPRRFFRFSLRTMLLLVLVAAIPLALVQWRLARARQTNEIVAAIERDGGHVRFDYEVQRGLYAGLMRWVPGSAEQLAGKAFFGDVLEVKFPRIAMHWPAIEATDDTLALLDRLPHLRRLSIVSEGLTDRGLASLANCKLSRLELHTYNVTDNGLRSLANCRSLKRITLTGCSQITPDALAPIAGLPALDHLQIQWTRINDEGLRALEGSRTLRTIVVWDEDNITRAGIERLQKALPYCTVKWDQGHGARGQR
jgi:hypothetical protein